MSALQISRDICSVDGGLVERISIGLRERELRGSLTCDAVHLRSIRTYVCIGEHLTSEESFLCRESILFWDIC